MNKPILSKIKLNKFSKEELERREQNALKGGGACNCYCSCGCSCPDNRRCSCGYDGNIEELLFTNHQYEPVIEWLTTSLFSPSFDIEANIDKKDVW